MTGRTSGLLGRLAGLFFFSGVLISAGPAFGQSAADQTTTATDQTTAQAGTASGTLQEVVVTAERRAENVQTTPISVVAISGDQLLSQQITNVQSLEQLAPNLSVTGNGGTINIRGVGNHPSGAFGQNGVAIIHDGLPNVGSTGINTAYFDIADVEVLRGPQGTFSGDNSDGGAIQITSNDPNFRGVNGSADFQVATYSDLRFQGAVNLPASDTVALRLAFNEETRGSYYYDEGAELTGPELGGPHFNPAITTPGGDSTKTLIDPGNVDNKDVRLGVLWKPTDNFTSLTKIEVDNDNNQGTPAQVNINTFTEPAGLPCPSGMQSPTPGQCWNRYAPYYSGSPYVLNDAYTGLFNSQLYNYYSEQLNWTLASGIELRSITGDQESITHGSTSVSGTSLDYGHNDATTTVHAFTQEIDALSPTTGKFSWVAGANMAYTQEQFLSFNTNYAPPYTQAAPSYSMWNREFLWIRSQGVFGQVSWQFTPTLQLQAGLRDNWDTQPSHVGGQQTDRPPPFPAAETVNEIGWKDSGTLTGKVGLNWTPLSGQYFYAFAARGYKPGANNEGDTPPTNKETTHDFELGWKGTLVGGHLQTQLGGYYTQYYDMTQAIYNIYNVTATGGANLSFSIVKGIEASMQTQVGHFGANLSASLNKSVLGPLTTAETYKFPVGYGITNQCAPGQVPNAQLSNCTNYSPYLVSLSGEELPYAPLFQANATLQYAIPLGTMSLTPRVVYSYNSRSYSSVFQSDNYYLTPASHLLSGYLDWTTGNWTTTLWATNLPNNVYYSNPGLYNPRQVGLEIHTTF